MMAYVVGFLMIFWALTIGLAGARPDGRNFVRAGCALAYFGGIIFAWLSK